MVRLGREGSQAGVGDGDLMGPGPGWVDLEELASGGADEASGDGPQAQPQAFGLVIRAAEPVRASRWVQASRSWGQGGDLQPDPVLGQVVVGYLESISPSP